MDPAWQSHKKTNHKVLSYIFEGSTFYHVTRALKSLNQLRLRPRLFENKYVSTDNCIDRKKLVETFSIWFLKLGQEIIGQVRLGMCYSL